MKKKDQADPQADPQLWVSLYLEQLLKQVYCEYAVVVPTAKHLALTRASVQSAATSSVAFLKANAPALLNEGSGSLIGACASTGEPVNANLFTDARYKGLVEANAHRFMAALAVPIKNKATGQTIAVLMAINKSSVNRIELGTSFSSTDVLIALRTAELISEQLGDEEVEATNDGTRTTNGTRTSAVSSAATSLASASSSSETVDDSMAEPGPAPFPVGP